MKSSPWSNIVSIRLRQHRRCVLTKGCHLPRYRLPHHLRFGLLAVLLAFLIIPHPPQHVRGLIRYPHPHRRRRPMTPMDLYPLPQMTNTRVLLIRTPREAL